MAPGRPCAHGFAVMQEVDLKDAATALPQLVEAALRGEEVVLLRDGLPVARLLRYDTPDHPRPLGWGRADGMWMAEELVGLDLPEEDDEATH